MPLAKQDILDLLSDRRLSRIDFWVENLHVKPQVWALVRDFIDREDIWLVPGEYPNNAFYNDGNDTLTTPDVSPPPSADTAGLIFHECIYVYIDMVSLKITSLSEEIAAYLVQHTYLLLVNPSLALPTSSDWLKFFQHCIDLAKAFKLHQPEGQGAKLSFYNIVALRLELNQLPSKDDYYRNLKSDTMSAANGVTRKIHVRHIEREPVDISIASPPHPVSFVLSDSLLIEILEKRYAANDVAGFGGRVKRLEQLFRAAQPSDARRLVPRISSRIAGDKVSMYYHDHLSTATRINLLGILKLRVA